MSQSPDHFCTVSHNWSTSFSPSAELMTHLVHLSCSTHSSFSPIRIFSCPVKSWLCWIMTCEVNLNAVCGPAPWQLAPSDPGLCAYWVWICLYSALPLHLLPPSNPVLRILSAHLFTCVSYFKQLTCSPQIKIIYSFNSLSKPLSSSKLSWYLP